MKKYHITVKPTANKSLTSLYRKIDRKFPDLDQIVDTFSITEGKKPLFGAGDAKIEEIIIVWNIKKPEQSHLAIIDQILEIIKNSDSGEAEIIISEKSQ